MVRIGGVSVLHKEPPVIEYLVITRDRVARKGHGTERVRTRYRVQVTEAGQGQEHRTVRLTKVVANPDHRKDGYVDTQDVYDVTLTEYGPTCDCADFSMKREGLDARGCKHIRACQLHDLI